MATVLVGTDGSPNAVAALQWALEHARRKNASLRAMHVWHYPDAASGGHGGFAGLVLGSVATHCTRHAKVPTVVVPNAISGDAQ